MGELGSLRRRPTVSAHALVALGLPDPLPYGRLGEVNLPAAASALAIILWIIVPEFIFCLQRGRGR
jgi:hypothetical protein